VAAITTKLHGSPTEVQLGTAEGLKGVSCVNIANVFTVRQADLGRYVGTLSRAKMADVCGHWPSRWAATEAQICRVDWKPLNGSAARIDLTSMVIRGCNCPHAPGQTSDTGWYQLTGVSEFLPTCKAATCLIPPCLGSVSVGSRPMID
jgi:hypothetical protein